MNVNPPMCDWCRSKPATCFRGANLCALCDIETRRKHYSPAIIAGLVEVMTEQRTRQTKEATEHA